MSEPIKTHRMDANLIEAIRREGRDRVEAWQYICEHWIEGRYPNHVWVLDALSMTYSILIRQMSHTNFKVDKLESHVLDLVKACSTDTLLKAIRTGGNASEQAWLHIVGWFKKTAEQEALHESMRDLKKQIEDPDFRPDVNLEAYVRSVVRRRKAKMEQEGIGSVVKALIQKLKPQKTKDHDLDRNTAQKAIPSIFKEFDGPYVKLTAQVNEPVSDVNPSDATRDERIKKATDAVIEQMDETCKTIMSRKIEAYSMKDIAIELGWYDKEGKPDDRRVIKKYQTCKQGALQKLIANPKLMTDVKDALENG